MSSERTTPEFPPIPARCIAAGARNLNEAVDPATLHRAGEGQPDAEEAVARAVLEGVAWGTGATGLMDLARLILLTHYPEDVFVGRRRNPQADAGVQLVQALRACDDAMKGSA